jgi:hypothetical protein
MDEPKDNNMPPKASETIPDERFRDPRSRAAIAPSASPAWERFRDPRPNAHPSSRPTRPGAAPEPEFQLDWNPRNGVAEMSIAVPPELSGLVDKLAAEIMKERKLVKWPHAPYHFGMGRMLAYEQWLSSLDLKQMKEEVARCIAATTNYYDLIAYKVMRKLLEQGINIRPYMDEFHIRRMDGIAAHERHRAAERIRHEELTRRRGRGRSRTP